MLADRKMLKHSSLLVPSVPGSLPGTAPMLRIKKANKATVATVRTLMQSAGTWDDGLYTGEVCPETGVPNDTGTKAYPVGGGPHPYATGT